MTKKDLNKIIGKANLSITDMIPRLEETKNDIQNSTNSPLENIINKVVNGVENVAETYKSFYSLFDELINYINTNKEIKLSKKDNDKIQALEKKRKSKGKQRIGELLSELILIIEPFLQETKRLNIKRSAHIVRELNKYKTPAQLNIFDTLSSETQQKITSLGVTVEHINNRGNATPFTKGHYKLIDCMSELLSDKSSSLNYEGNAKVHLVKYGQRNVEAPALALSLYEIAKKYNAGIKPSGKVMKRVNDFLTDLADNPEYRILIKHIRESKNSKGDKIKDTIEEFSPLLKVITAKQEITQKSTGKTSKKKELIIVLNPIFNDQINSKWVEYPSNLVQRMIEAYGGANIAEATYKFLTTDLTKVNMVWQNMDKVVWRSYNLYFHNCYHWRDAVLQKSEIEPVGDLPWKN